MKRLSVFLLLLGLVGCKYPSKEQARIACEEWKENGDSIIYSDPNLDPGNRYTVSSRYCRDEEATTQFLGRESKEAIRLIREGKIREAKDVEWKDYKIVKHFRY